ncbi:MAG: tetratricopeptide repeat protein [Planctomycetota bacterium]
MMWTTEHAIRLFAVALLAASLVVVGAAAHAQPRPDAASAAGNALQRTVPADGDVRLSAFAVDTEETADGLPALADALDEPGPVRTSVPRVVLALRALLAMQPDAPAHRRLAGAAVLDEWRRHAGRWLAWARARTAPQGQLASAAARWAYDGINLRIYPPAARVRLPLDVIASRGGTPLEVALTLHLLAALLRFDTTMWFARDADDEPMRDWRVQLKFAREGSANMRPLADTPGSEGTMRRVMRDLLAREIAAQHAQPLPAAPDDQIAQLEFNRRLLETLIALFADPRATPADEQAKRRRMAELVNTLSDLWQRLREADPDRAGKVWEQINSLIATLRRSSSLEPDLLFSLGLLAMRAGDSDGAIQNLEQLVRDFPQWKPQSGDHQLILLARLLDGTGDVPGALQRYADAAAANVASGADLTRAADIAWTHDKRDVALALHEQAEALGYPTAAYHYRHGVVLRARNTDVTRQTAISSFRTAVALKPDMVQPWLELIRCQLELATTQPDRERWVAAALKSAVEAGVSVKDPAPFMRLEAMIYLQWLGNRDGAKAALERYLAHLRSTGRKDPAAEADYERLK